MNFKPHSFRPHPELEGRHAFLSASKYHWVNDDEVKILERFDKYMDAALGTRLHAFAAEAIKLGQNLPDNGLTLSLYVNDCIGYRMRVEQPLFYSENAFGTCDAIWYGLNPQAADGRYILRVFDLKNGVTPVKVTQLELYVAFFCLEYGINPRDLDFDLRIYQNDDIAFFDTDPLDIQILMDLTVDYDKLLKKAKEV